MPNGGISNSSSGGSIPIGLGLSNSSSGGTIRVGLSAIDESHVSNRFSRSPTGSSYILPNTTYQGQVARSLNLNISSNSTPKIGSSIDTIEAVVNSYSYVKLMIKEAILLGYLDSGGSLRVNLNKKTSCLEFSVILSVENSEINRSYFKIISKYLGKCLITSDKKNHLLLIINNMKVIKDVLNVLNKGEPLNLILKSQVKFFEDCLNHKNIQYKKNINLKYKSLDDLSKQQYTLRLNSLYNLTRFTMIIYNIIQYKNNSIIIQHKDYFLIKTLNNSMFNSKIRYNRVNNSYYIEVYNQKTINIINEYINEYITNNIFNK